MSSRRPGRRQQRVPAADKSAFPLMADVLLGHVVETDLETGARQCREAARVVLRLVAADDGRKWLHVKRPRGGVGAYDLADADGVTVAAAGGRAALRFARPRRQVIVQADRGDAGRAVAFVRAIRAAARRQGARLDDAYAGPSAADGYASADRYDRVPGADLGGRLNALVLENVDATGLRGQIGRLPVSYVSLSGSTLDTGDHTANWDWMAGDTIGATLTVLAVDAVGLRAVPLEIAFLRRLRTLSLASNKLTHIPHFLGDLKELDCLFIDGNMLTYLPICLKYKTFKHLNVSKNQLEEFVVELHENKSKQFLKTKRSSKNPVSINLFSLALYSLIDNCVKFRRQNLCLSIRHYFDMVYRCPECNHLMIPDNNTEFYEFGHASTINLIQSFVISWQTYECNYSKCSSHINYFQNLY